MDHCAVPLGGEKGWGRATKGKGKGKAMGATMGASPQGREVTETVNAAMHTGANGSVSAHPGYPVGWTPQYACEHLPSIPAQAKAQAWDRLRGHAVEGQPGQKPPGQKGGKGAGEKGQGNCNKGWDTNYWGILQGNCQWRNSAPGQMGDSHCAQRGVSPQYIWPVT